MIFFGTKARTISGPIVTNVSCPSCGRAEFESVGIQSYAHLYWIPVFPTSKKVVLTCKHCRLALEGKDLQPEIRRELRSRIFRPAQKIPLFAGTFIIALLIMWGVSAGRQDDAREMSYLENPQVHDLYVVKYTEIFEGMDADYPYGVLSVIAVDADSVECLVGGAMYSHASGPREDIRKNKTDDDGYFAEYPASFGRAELLEMKQARTIVEVERDDEQSLTD